MERQIFGKNEDETEHKLGLSLELETGWGLGGNL
jgi:hypothetical protein